MRTVALPCKRAIDATDQQSEPAGWLSGQSDPNMGKLSKQLVASCQDATRRQSYSGVCTRRALRLTYPKALILVRDAFLTGP